MLTENPPPEAATKSRVAAMMVAIFAITSLADTRASGSGKRLLRLQSYVMTLVWHLKRKEKFRAILTPSFIDDLQMSIPMYDIGRIGIPDWILLKPTTLTLEEFRIVKTHTTLARDALALAQEALGHRSQTLETMKELAYSHHEKWNGRGYPLGLSGERIPLAARLMAVADVYDALVSNKVYRDGISLALRTGFL